MKKGSSPGLALFPSSGLPISGAGAALGRSRGPHTMLLQSLLIPGAKELTWAPHYPLSGANSQLAFLSECQDQPPDRQLSSVEPLEGRRPLASQEEVSLTRKELAVAQDSSWGPRLGRVRLLAQQSRLRSSEETLLLKEA